MKKIIFSSIVCSMALFGSGYKVPETSTNAVALGAANIAHVNSADAAYYNPANMAFMDESKNSLEFDVMNINLDKVKYKSSSADIASKKETYFLPSINYVSPLLGERARIGFSINVPGGLSKRWKDSPAKDRAEEFTLEVIELNPSVALKINQKLAVAFGLRAIYSKGVVKSESLASRDLKGDSLDFGYNLALSYRPLKELELSATFRSNVDLTEEGNAKLYIGNYSGALVYDGGAGVTVPLPATVSLAGAWSFDTKTTVELVYERVLWSKYKSLDFNYASSIQLILKPSFDDPISKNYSDSNTFRLGVTQEFDNFKLMAGAVYDNTPVPEKTLGYEMPDTDSYAFSLGGRYNIKDNFDIGLAGLYSIRKSRSVSNGNGINGEFSGGNVLILSAGVGYRF